MPNSQIKLQINLETYKILQQVIQNLDQFDPKIDLENLQTTLQNDLQNNGLKNGKLQNKIGQKEFYYQKNLKKLQETEPETYKVARQNHTEQPFSGEYCGLKEEGDYYCRVCDQYLFDSSSKFDSATGWPSYYRAAKEFSIKTKIDKSYGMRRVEVICGRCGSHLGHLFGDGPAPSGERFCVNSRVLQFAKTGEKLNLISKILSKHEIETLNLNEKQSHNLEDFINIILNNLNQNKITLKNAQLEIESLITK